MCQIIIQNKGINLVQSLLKKSKCIIEFTVIYCNYYNLLIGAKKNTVISMVGIVVWNVYKYANTFDV